MLIRSFITHLFAAITPWWNLRKADFILEQTFEISVSYYHRIFLKIIDRKKRNKQLPTDKLYFSKELHYLYFIYVLLKNILLKYDKI